MTENDPIVTLFAAPKRFAGAVGKAQERAIQSWLQLGPGCNVLLLGDEDGIEAAARAFGTGYLAHVDRNEFGTPLVNSIFQAAERWSNSRLLCYVNADIILTQDFLRAVKRIPYSRFLMIGRRCDTDPRYVPDPSVPGWERCLREQAALHGRLHEPTGIDYFVFSRGLCARMPPFAVGRPMWDNWLVFHARASRVPVIDATAAVLAVHQNHDYSHHAGGESGVCDGPEAVRNRALAGGYRRAFTIDDATHVLDANGLKREITPKHVWRRIIRLPALYPAVGAIADPIGKPGQHALHLCRSAATYLARRAR